MRIELLKFIQFRNYAALEFRPDEKLSILLGENAQGKTNVVEAIYLCAAGRSHRTSRDGRADSMGERRRICTHRRVSGGCASPHRNPPAQGWKKADQGGRNARAAHGRADGLPQRRAFFARRPSLGQRRTGENVADSWTASFLRSARRIFTACRNISARLRSVTRCSRTSRRVGKKPGTLGVWV